MRNTLAAFAVILATLLVPLGIGATWLALRVDDTQAYVDAVAPLADNAELRSRLADEVATAAIATLQDSVPVGLPDSLDSIVRTSARTVVESDEFPTFWRAANADAHREFLAIVHDKAGHVDTSGWVVVDLRPLLDSVLKDVVKDVAGGAAIIDAMPKTPLPLPVVRDSDLEKGRGLYRLLDALSLWLPLLWAALIVLAVLVAVGWRARVRALAFGALGLALGGAVVLACIGPATDLVVGQAESEKRDLARLVIDVVVDSLHDEALTTLVAGGLIGIALLVVSLLPGRSRSAYT